MQNGKMIAYGSRILTDSERRYSNIEREMLAIAWWLEKFHTYLYGRKVIVETDHKPLETIFKKSLNSAPPRLQGMLLLTTSDCLSRAPLNVTESTNINDEQIEVNLVDRLGLDNDLLSKFRVQTSADETSIVVMEYVLKGWP